MENFPSQNINEHNNNTIVLDSDKIMRETFGHPVKVVAEDLLKIYSIISHIANKKPDTMYDIKKTAEDLFKELDVQLLDFKSVFTTNLLGRILEQQPVTAISVELNGGPLSIEAGSTLDSIMNKWNSNRIGNNQAVKEEMQVRKLQHLESVKENQEKIDIMFNTLETLDFSNQEVLIDWLFEYNKHYIRDVDMHIEKVREIFRAHGYSSKDNDAINAELGEILQDKERIGRVLIGYFLQNGALTTEPGSLLVTLEKQINDWKKY